MEQFLFPPYLAAALSTLPSFSMMFMFIVQQSGNVHAAEKPDKEDSLTRYLLTPYLLTRYLDRNLKFEVLACS